MRYGAEKKIEIKPISNFKVVTGKGVISMLKGTLLALGNEKITKQLKAKISPQLQEQVTAEQRLGKTVAYLADANNAIGFVLISDNIKTSDKKAIKKLQNDGMKMIMFTGITKKPKRL